jgi:TorA maturation chaperone TorD
MQRRELRSELYALLSEGFKEPTADFVREWTSAEMAAYLHQAFTELGYSIPIVYYTNWAALIKDVNDQRIAFYEAFEGRKLFPIESIYRQWTHDESAEVPFAKEKGYLMSDAALHMLELYRQYGIEFPAQFQGQPDHLCLELEFMSFLVSHGNEEMQRTFLHEHLDWLDDFCSEAHNKGLTGFYANLVALVQEFVCQERKQSNT